MKFILFIITAIFGTAVAKKISAKMNYSEVPISRVIKNPNFKNKKELEKSLISKGIGAKDWLTTHIEVENLNNKKLGVSIGVGHRVFFDKVDGKAKKHKLTDERENGKDYILMQSAKCCVEIHPDYAKYFDIQHEEVRLEEERWVVERLADDEWVEINSYNPRLSTEEIKNGIKVVSKHNTNFGLLTVEYIQRDGRFLKHNITFKNDSNSTETFRVLQKWTGVAGDKINGNKITEKTDIKGNTFVFGDNSNPFKIKESSISLKRQGLEDMLEIITGNREPKKEEVKKDGFEMITNGIHIAMNLDGKGTMYSNDFELSTMVASVKKCPEDSRVFIGGLGLGMILIPLAISRKSKEVIICEQDSRVIDFVAPRVKAWFKKRYPDFNFTIIQGDATKEVANHGKFDWIFMDLNRPTSKELCKSHLTEKGEYTDWFDKEIQNEKDNILYLDSIKADIDSRGLKTDFTYENWVLGQGDSLVIDPDTATLDNPTVDGNIRYDVQLATYARTTTGFQCLFFYYYDTRASRDQYERAYVEWDISAIGDTNTVSKVEFRYDGYTHNAAAGGNDIRAMASQPSVQDDDNTGNAIIWNDVGDGTAYLSNNTTFPVIGQNQDVGGSGEAWDTDPKTDVTAALANDWFALGFKNTAETVSGTSNATGFRAEEDTTPAVPDPTLYLEYSIAVTTRRRVIISGFIKMKQLILIGALMISFALGFIASMTPCKYYVWHKGEKECISEEIKEYIENVESGNIDRLKSKRGIFSQ